MGINKFELALASYLEYKGQITFEHFERKYGKSVSSLKRNIYNLNTYLTEDRHYILETDRVVNQMGYEELLHFIDGLNLSSYSPSKEERMYLLSVCAFFEAYVNMTALYDEIEMSQTARKSDSRDLAEFLKGMGLSKKTVSSKGLTVTGSEEKFRMLITSILSSYLEIDLNDEFMERRANNPLEKFIYHYFYCKAMPFLKPAKEILNQFVKDKNCRLSYPSKKFFMIYIINVLHRNARGIYIEKRIPFRVKAEKIQLFDRPYENYFASHLVGSLDFIKPMNEMVYDEKLILCTRAFLKIVLEKMITKIYTYDNLFEEIYAYLKKAILTNALRKHFYDIKLDETYIHIKRMYNILCESVYKIEEYYDFQVSKDQIAELALIFRKYVIKNRVFGRNTKKIIIVTNSSVEKTNFFYIFLKQYVDVQLVGIININELHMLKEFEYDYIFTFSNRIKNLIYEIGLNCIRLNFYITHDEIAGLIEQGFSTAIRKIHLDTFAEEIQHRDKEEIIKYLAENYSDYFVFQT